MVATLLGNIEHLIITIIAQFILLILLIYKDRK